MNLRNIIWHGFWNPIDTNISFSMCNSISLILVIIQNLLHPHFIKFENITESPSLLSCSIDKQLFNFGKGDDFLLNLISKYSKNETDNKNLLIDIKRIIELSDFNIPSRLPIYNEILNIVFNFDEFKSKNLGISIESYLLYLFLPSFEMKLRRLFVSSNNLSNELLCAQSRIYYTTIDVFIAPTFVRDNKWDKSSNLQQVQPNKIIEELENNYKVSNAIHSFSHYLLDLLIQPSGPRIRDKIAHFEWNLDTIPFLFIDRFILFWIWMSWKFVKNQNDCLHKFVCLNTKNFLHEIDWFFESFTSCFHPITILQKNLRKTILELKVFQNYVQTDLNSKKNENLTQGEIEFFDHLPLTQENSLILKVNKNSSLSCESMVENLKNSILIEFGFPSDLSFSKENLENLDNNCIFYPTTNIYNQYQLGIINLLRIIEQEIKTMISNLFKKWMYFKEKFLTMDCSKRQINAFSKFSRKINDYDFMLQSIILVIESIIRSFGTNECIARILKQKLQSTTFGDSFTLINTNKKFKVNSKWISKLLSSIEKSISKLDSNNWSEVTSFYQESIMRDIFTQFVNQKH